MFVAYISFNKHFKKLQKYYNRHHIGVCLMIKQCTGIYVCPVAPTTKVTLIDNNCCPVVRPVRLVIRATIWPLAAGAMLSPVLSSPLFLDRPVA